MKLDEGTIFGAAIILFMLFVVICHDLGRNRRQTIEANRRLDETIARLSETSSVTDAATQSIVVQIDSVSHVIIGLHPALRKLENQMNYHPEDIRFKLKK